MSMPTLRRWIGGGIRANVVAIALFAHLAILIALLLPRLPTPEPDGVAIELVQSNGGTSEMQAAAEPVAGPAPPTEPSPAEPTPPTLTPPEPAPAIAEAAPPPPQPEPMPRRAYTAEANTIVRDDSASVTTRGDDTLQPQMTGHRNASPLYPPEAERRRMEGEVRVLIRVSRDGIPAAVEVVSSSGIPMLDRAAVETLQTWRFAPARPAAYPFNIRFVLGQR